MGPKWSTWRVENGTSPYRIVCKKPSMRQRGGGKAMHLRQRESHLVCLSCSAESATEALSFALHSVPRVFHLALRRVNVCLPFVSEIWEPIAL